MTFQQCVISCVDNLQRVDNSDADFVWEQLSKLEPFLPLGYERQKENTDLSCAYQILLKKVLNSKVINDYGTSQNKTSCLELVFLRALHVDSIFTLVGFINEVNPSRKLDCILTLVETFFTNGSFLELCQDQCCVSIQDIEVKSAWKPIWDKLVTLIVSLPTRVYNKKLEKTWEVFENSRFCDLMSKTLFSTLQFVHNQLQENRNVSLEFQSLLLGRLFATGYGDSVLKKLIPNLLHLLQDFLWKKVVQKLILNVSEKYFENIITSLLLHTSWYGFVDFFIGNAGVEKGTIKYLMSKKLILIRFFENPDILFKCIGYYSMSPSRHNVLLILFQNLLDIWGKKSALKHQSESQHLYLSCGIMVCSAFLPSIDFSSKKSVLMKHLLGGVQTHIESTLLSVRTQGMVVGQSVSSILDPEGPKLSFEFETNQDTNLLLSLLHIPQKPEESTSNQEDTKTDNCQELLVKISPQHLQEQTLDSDDDLEPYEQSNDTVFSKDKPPVYVQDIINGLSDHSQPNYTNMCLNMAEMIIRAQSRYTQSVSEELAKILLHLEDTFAGENFIQYRFRAMVSVTVVSPESVSKYLTSQFYNNNYNVRQKLDILEVLVAASQELSQGSADLKTNTVSTPDASLLKLNNNEEHWSEVIQKRIDAKTRRFGKGSKKTVPKPVVNKFGPVAGGFFFPLLRYYDNLQSGLDMLGEDSYVLGRLIYSLGLICNSAANTLIIRQMAKAMLDFMWTLRYHIDVFVRQALLFSLCMVVVNTPPTILSQDFQTEIYECQLWLRDVLERDPNKECQKCAAQVLTLIHQLVSKTE